MVILKNFEPALSYILAEIFYSCLTESCFPDCVKVSSVLHVLKNVGEECTAKTYHPVNFLFVVSKTFKKPVGKRLVEHLENFDFFSDFKYGFRPSRSTADLLTVASDRTARFLTSLGLLEL